MIKFFLTFWSSFFFAQNAGSDSTLRILTLFLIFWSSFSWLFDQVFSWSKECRQTSAAGSHPWMWDLFPLPQMISKERNFWVREKSQSSRWFCRVCNIYLLSFYRSHNFGLFNAHLMSYLRCLFCASVLVMLQSNMINWDVVDFFSDFHVHNEQNCNYTVQLLYIARAS